MELINFDISKSLEELEAGTEPSYVRGRSRVSRVQGIRKKPVKDFTIEELRSMINQNSSLKFLVPLAIQKLHVDALVKGDVHGSYEGDLLNAVLTVEKKYWMEDLKGIVPMLEAIIETALAIANSKPEQHAKFLQDSKNAINIFKANVGI